MLISVENVSELSQDCVSDGHDNDVVADLKAGVAVGYDGFAFFCYANLKL